MSDKYVIYYLQTRACVVEWPGQCHFLLCRWQSLKQSVWTDDRVTGVDRDISTSVPLELFAKTLERQATSYSKLLQITWSDLMLDWCLRQSTSHRVSAVYHSYGGMVDMWHRNICWSIWALIYSIAGQRQDGHHHRRIQQEEVVWSVVSSCVFLFAWQVMAEGDQSASAAQARSLSGSKHIGQWLLSKVLDKWFGKQLVLWHPAQQPTRAQAQAETWIR